MANTYPLAIPAPACISALEGTYSKQQISRSVESHLALLLGLRVPTGTVARRRQINARRYEMLAKKQHLLWKTVVAYRNARIDLDGDENAALSRLSSVIKSVVPAGPLSSVSIRAAETWNKKALFILIGVEALQDRNVSSIVIEAYSSQ
jgi:hypothetical protein